MTEPQSKPSSPSSPVLVLASSSRYRRAQMKSLKVDCIARDPLYREEHDLNLPPEKLVVHMALQKARSVATLFQEAFIIGSDQILVADGRVLTKPLTFENAADQLSTLSGREHLLLTSVAVVGGTDGRAEWDLDVERIRLRRVDPEAIRRYIHAEKPLDCVGALKVEGLGITLVESIRGVDPSAVIGLPLVRLVTLLRKFGIRVP